MEHFCKCPERTGTAQRPSLQPQNRGYPTKKWVAPGWLREQLGGLRPGSRFCPPHPTPLLPASHLGPSPSPYPCDLFVCFLVKKVSGNQKRSEIFFNIAEVQSYIFCYKYCSPERTHFACVCVRARVCARGDLKVEPAPWLQSSI